MDARTYLFTAGAVTLALPLLAEVLSRIGLWLRTARYRRYGDRTDFPPFSAQLAQELAGGEYRSLLPGSLLADHNAANILQARSFKHLVSAACMLLASYVVACASITVLVANETAHVISAMIDVVALTLVIAYYLAAVRTRSRWIERRSGVELLRQLDVVACLLSFSSQDDLVRRYERLRASVTDAISKKPQELRETVEQVGEQCLAELESELRQGSELSIPNARTYVVRRALRQSRWFFNSFTRLSAASRSRARMLLLLFCGAILMAITKLICIASHGASEEALEWLDLILLISIGVSSCATAVFVGQNTRSLVHRYRQQLRAIEAWFTSNEAILSTLREPAGHLRNDKKEVFVLAVLDFERLMVSELLDWIAVSSEDAMELSL